MSAATFTAEEARGRWVGAGLALAVVASAAGLAWAPLLTLGSMLGAALLLATLRWPLAVVGAMLFIGPVNLSFVTGGFKHLLEGLGGLDMNGIRLVMVSAGLWLCVLADRRQWPRLISPPVVGYLAFLAWITLTLPRSADPLEGLRLAAKLDWPLVIYLVLSGPDRTSQEIDRLLDWALVGAALIILLNPVSALEGNVVHDVGGEVRYMGAGTHQNPFSFYLLVIALIALARFVVRGGWRYLALIVGAVVWIALTFTRITFLAGLVALAVVGLEALLVRRNWKAAAWGAALGAGVVALMAQAFLVRTFGYVPGPMEVIDLIQHPVALYSSINWSGRELFWGALVAAWSMSPLIGLGLGSSTAILRTLFHEDQGLVAHNEYIRLGTDTGVVGIALFALAMLAWLRVALRATLLPGRRAEEVALPAVAVLVSWGIISITDNAFDYYGAFTQFAAVLVAACALHLRESEEATP